MPRDKEGVKVGADIKTELGSPQAALVDLLDAPVHPQRVHAHTTGRRGSFATPSVHSVGRISRSRSQSRERINDSDYRHHHRTTPASFRSRSSDRLDRSMHDLNSEYGGLSYRGGDRLVLLNLLWFLPF